MQLPFQRYLLPATASVHAALRQLDLLAADAVLFLVDGQGRLRASLTDGDIRRGLINGRALSDPLLDFTQQSPKFFRRGRFDLAQMQAWRSQNYRIIPVLGEDDRVVDVVNFRTQRSYLPVDALIMAGGLGSRLRPLTDTVPKPLLPVGDKPIVAHNIDRLRAYGVRHLTLSLKYRAQQVMDHFGDGTDRGMHIRYVTEDEPRGTIGAASQVATVHNDYLLVMNSDLLTTIDFESMFAHLLEQEADMVVATVPYEIKVPYGIVETEGDRIRSFREKPTYVYYSNAGIYLFPREHLAKIPRRGRYDAPDLMQALIDGGHKVVQFPVLSYWLDIGNPTDYQRAQEDIKHLTL